MVAGELGRPSDRPSCDLELTPRRRRSQHLEKQQFASAAARACVPRRPPAGRADPDGRKIRPDVQMKSTSLATTRRSSSHFSMVHCSCCHARSNLVVRFASRRAQRLFAARQSAVWPSFCCASAWVLLIGYERTTAASQSVRACGRSACPGVGRNCVAPSTTTAPSTRTSVSSLFEGSSRNLLQTGRQTASELLSIPRCSSHCDPGDSSGCRRTDSRKLSAVCTRGRRQVLQRYGRRGSSGWYEMRQCEVFVSLLMDLVAAVFGMTAMAVFITAPDQSATTGQYGSSFWLLVVAWPLLLLSSLLAAAVSNSCSSSACSTYCPARHDCSSCACVVCDQVWTFQ
jgi:hypothetical protein